MKNTIYKKLLYILAFLTLCYLAIFLVLAPYIVTSVLPSKLKEEKNIDLKIDSFFANPLLLTFNIKNITLSEHNKTIINIENIFIDLGVIKSIFSHPSINNIKIKKPIVNVYMDENKTIDLLKLAEKFKSKEESEKAIFNIESLSVSNGIINFKDHANFESNITNLDIKANSLTNQKDTNGTISISALFDGSKTELDTICFLDKNNFLSSFKIYNLESKKYITYFTNEFSLDTKIYLDANVAYVDKNISINIEDANLTNIIFNDKKSITTIEKLNLQATYSNNELKKAFSKLTNIAINDLNSSFFKINEIALNDISYQKNLLEISKINVEKPSIMVTILKNFETNIVNFINKYKSQNKNETNESIAIKIDALNIQNANLQIKDTNIEPNTQFEVSNINAKIKDFNSKTPDTTNLKLSLNTPISGNVELNGTKSNMNINAKNIYLPILEPYIQKNANLNFKSGTLSLDGLIGADKNLTLRANASLNNIFITDKNSSPIVKLPLININKILFENGKTTISELLIKEPEAFVSIYKNQKTNLTNLLISSNQNDKNSSSNFAIVTLKLQNGILNFSDDSLPIDFHTKIQNLNGTVYALGSDVTLPTSFNFRGEIPEYGYAKIKATANLSTIFKNSSFNIEFENIDIDTLSPYTMKFIGYKLEDGKLWLDLNYNINNYKLTSTNKIKIKDLKLGDIVDENATSLPLSLIISLLSDSDGYIKFEIPVSGSVDNPEFNLSSVIKDAIFTTLAHIAESPFTFLASLFDSDEEELSNIYFDAGSSKLLPPQKESLAKLKQILIQKQAIKISINGTYSEEDDTKALKMREFNRLMTKKYGETSFGDSKFEFIKKEYIARFGNKKFLDESQKYNLKIVADQEIFTQEMIYQIIDNTAVSKAGLQKLALARANAIFVFLTEDNKLDSKRVLINNNASESTNIKDGDIASKLEIITN